MIAKKQHLQTVAFLLFLVLISGCFSVSKTPGTFVQPVMLTRQPTTVNPTLLPTSTFNSMPPSLNYELTYLLEVEDDAQNVTAWKMIGASIDCLATKKCVDGGHVILEIPLPLALDFRSYVWSPDGKKILLHASTGTWPALYVGDGNFDHWEKLIDYDTLLMVRSNFGQKLKNAVSYPYGR